MAENTSQAASVEFARLRRANYARSGLQKIKNAVPKGTAFFKSFYPVDVAIQERHGLAARAGGVGGEGGRAGALGDALADSPQDGVIVARLVHGADILERVGVVAAGLARVAVQERHDLRARALLIRGEGRRVGTGGDALLAGPQDGLVIAGVSDGVHIGERVAGAGRLRRTGGAPQEGHDLGAVAVLVRGEGRAGRAVGDLVVHRPLDRLIEEVARLDVDEVHRLGDGDSHRTGGLFVLGAVNGEGDVDGLAGLGPSGGVVGDVRKVILRAGGLIVELVGAVGQLAGGVAAVGAVQTAVSVGGDVLAAHVELDIVELSLAVRGLGVLQEVDEVARGQLDGVVDADGVGDVFLDDGDDDVDVIVDLVGLSAVGLFDLAIDAEGQGDGVLAGLGDRVEADLVHVGHVGLALVGRGDLGAAVIQRALALGAGDGGGQDGVVKGDLVLLGVVIAIVLGVILKEALEVLLVEGHALARDNIVVDVVGLLGNGDRTGGSDVVIHGDNIEGSLAISVERAGGNSVVLVLSNGLPTSGGVRGSAPVTVVHVGLEAGAALIDVEVIVIAVGEGHGLASRSAGHSILDFALAVDSQVHGDNIIVVDLELEAGIANVSLVSVDGEPISDRAAIAQRGLAILKGDTAGRTNNSDGINIVVAEAAVLLLDCISEFILNVGLAVTIAIAIDDGAQLHIKSRDINGVLKRRVLLAHVGDGSGNGSGARPGSGQRGHLAGTVTLLFSLDKSAAALDCPSNIKTGIAIVDGMSGSSRAVKFRSFECAVIRQPISSNGLAGAFTVAVRGIGVIFHRDGDICRLGNRFAFLNGTGDRIVSVRRNRSRCLKSRRSAGVVVQGCTSRSAGPRIHHRLRAGTAISSGQVNFLAFINGDVVTIIDGKSLTRNRGRIDSNGNARIIRIAAGLNSQSIARITDITAGNGITCYGDIEVRRTEIRITIELVNRDGRSRARRHGILSTLIGDFLSCCTKIGLRIGNRNRRATLNINGLISGGGCACSIASSGSKLIRNRTRVGDA